MLGGAVLVACGSGPSGGAGGMATRDSAGVHIVENSGPAWAAGKDWTIAAAPSVDIAAGDAPGHDFGAVIAAVRLSDGRIAIASPSTNDIRIFGANGAHLRSTGRAGAGPGEFQNIAGLWASKQDSLLVLDVLTRRLTVLSPAGEFVRAFSLGGMSGGLAPTDGVVSLAIPIGWLTDGSVVGMAQSFKINDSRTGTYRDTIPVIRYGADGTVMDTVGRFPGIEMEQMTLTLGGQSFSAPSPVPLGKVTGGAAKGDKVYVVLNESWEIEVRGADGTLASLIRLSVPPRSLSESDVATHRAEQLKAIESQPQMRLLPDAMKKQFTERITGAKYPPALGYIGSVFVDDDGNLWAQETPVPGRKDSRYAVVRPDGRMLGWVTMPERFRPTHIGTDRVTGVWQDEDDVDHIRVYRIVKGDAE